MAIPSFRQRAGAIEIQNKLIKEKEEKKRREKVGKKEQISEEEHEKRVKKLKELGLLK